MNVKGSFGLFSLGAASNTMTMMNDTGNCQSLAIQEGSSDVLPNSRRTLYGLGISRRRAADFQR